MTFNQWCSGKPVGYPHSRMALEAVWNALVARGCVVSEVVSLLNELLDSFYEMRR